MKTFTSTAYSSADELIFGKSIHPVSCGFGLKIGDGTVYPEVNFTLPTMEVAPKHLPAILKEYREMITTVLERLTTLQVAGAVIEFEHAPQMTEHLEIGARVTELLKAEMQAHHDRTGMKTALRVTVCDIREKERPPRMRTGPGFKRMRASFQENARSGADLLSIESTGGKEVSDKALVEADVPGLLFALGVLAPRDMHFLWREIGQIAAEEGVVSAGDTACAFGNTAMVLADQRFIPNVLAAVVRAMTAVRSLVAFEEGAVGPSKDCAYEGPVLKAITGTPISLEGKTSACAHFSHVGNIASAMCDLWSNESVQNVRLLSGGAPEVFTEMLAYDCRLMNEALSSDQAHMLRDLLVRSDEYKNWQALIISPEASFRLAQALVAEKTDFQRTHRLGRLACEIIREADASGKLKLPKREQMWLTRIERALDEYDTEAKVMSEMVPKYEGIFLPKEYGL